MVRQKLDRMVICKNRQAAFQGAQAADEAAVGLSRREARRRWQGNRACLKQRNRRVLVRLVFLEGKPYFAIYNAADFMRDMGGAEKTRELLKKAEPAQSHYEAIDRALYGPYLLPIDVYYYGTTPITDNVWGRIGGHIFCYADE